MADSMRDPRLNVPLRNAKADLAPLQKLKDAGEVLDVARANVRMEPKQMADALGISHSLTLRGLKTGELTFQRLWELDDEYWAELFLAVARRRHIATVRTTLEFETRRSA